MKQRLAATILVLEALVVGFAALVAYGLRVAPGGLVLGVGGAFVLALVAVAAALRWGSYWAGWVLQAGLLASGLAVPTMFVVGGIFVVLWVVALRLGGRIDAERAAAAAD